MLISLQQLQKETAPIAPEVTTSAVPSSLKTITTGNVLTNTENLERRLEMIAAKAAEPADFAFERAIGRNDSLYSNFTELIMQTKRKVGRIVIKVDDKRIGFATGFMVSDDLLLTNWHVFEEASVAADSEVHFFYEYDAAGHPLTPIIFKFDVQKFFAADKALDYCFVAVQPTDVKGNFPLKEIGYLFLDTNLGKIGDEGVEKLNIIHHPLGDYKQISIRANTFTGINATQLFYETDTAQGSSGSPVFNDQWQVVGLHHKSVAKMSADGKDYIDAEGETIPVVDGKIDITKIVWLRNEGVRISVIVNHLLSQHSSNSLTQAITIPPTETSNNFSLSTNNVIQNSSANAITIQVPTTALQTPVDIRLSAPFIAVPSATNNRTIASDEWLLEIAKTDKEQSVDFSECKGYNAKFLGVHVPLPQPKASIKKQIARLANNTIELKYFTYSVIFNAVTHMPLLSAINVEGDPQKRLDNSDRNDDWLRDKRIDLECQLDDKFYRKSNFDRGHMSRWEDANWDDSEANAKRNGIYTCFYTNACPQVEKLNGAGGLWGKLEKQILEKGIKKEAGKQARMTVFNGPIFNPDKDKVFKGIVIPMEYFKIIVWLNNAGELKATAFKLSQETLVGDVKFDELMRLDNEALDIDANVQFKHYQCAIKSLSKTTKIDFKGLEKFDTFHTINGPEEMLLVDEEGMMI